MRVVLRVALVLCALMLHTTEGTDHEVFELSPSLGEEAGSATAAAAPASASSAAATTGAKETASIDDAATAVAAVEGNMLRQQAKWERETATGQAIIKAVGRAGEPKTTTAQELVDLENEAEARRLKLFEAAKAIKIQLRDQERRASEGLLRAKQAVDKARIKVKLAKVAMIKAADPLNAIRDEKACKQVPECLKEKRAAGGCSVDKFPISTCLKAKKRGGQTVLYVRAGTEKLLRYVHA